MNLITIELCAEDRARIDLLTERIERLSEAVERKSCDDNVKVALALIDQHKRESSAPVEAVPETPAPVEVEAAPVEEVPPAADPAPAPKIPSLAEFQKALSLRCAESEATKAKVRELLHEYAAAASQVPEEKRSEVLDRLAKL
jgi:hypothetical protein